LEWTASPSVIGRRGLCPACDALNVAVPTDVAVPAVA
jgi:hypothetical protein